MSLAKPKLFVGSSVAGVDYVLALQQNLQFNAVVRPWTQGIFQVGNYPLEDLIAALDECDFGAFIFLPQDVLVMNGQASLAVRDNVLFELGMFIGRLGRQRSFFIKPRGEDLHLPSDLAGVNPADFDRDDPNLVAGMGTASFAILVRMRAIGPKLAATAPAPALLKNYDRETALRNILEKSEKKPLVRGSKYSRSDLILPSGDLRTIENFEQVEAYTDEPVAELPRVTSSRSGRATDPVCRSLTPDQKVTWKWTDPKIVEDRRAGMVCFDPPLTKGRPISYSFERYVVNSMSFTQRERLDVTHQEERREAVSQSFRHLYDSYVLQLIFPERRFPQKLYVTAYPAGGARDDPETAFAESGKTVFADTRSILLNLSKPLPGYTYEINWDLPEDDALSQFDRIQAGFVEEMTRRLLALRVVHGLHATKVRESLLVAHQHALAAADGSTEELELTLYVYDRQKSGLVCVASLHADQVEKNWESYLFKPGRGVAGRSFRSRCIETSPAVSSTEPDRYEPVSEDEPDRPSVLIAIPLFYADCLGRSVGVLSIASRSPTSSLVALARDQTALNQLARALDGWYGGILAEALGVIPSAKFWTAGGATIENVVQP